MHNDNSIAHAQYFWHLRRDQNDTQPIGLKLVDKLIDFFLGPNVNAARWFIKDQHFWPGHQTARNRHFLLVTAGEQADSLFHRWRFNIEQANKIPYRLLLIFMFKASACTAEIAQRGQ